MDSKNEIIEFTKTILNKVSVIDDFIDKALEPFKDYTDTIEDIATPVKSFFSIISLRRKISLKKFIKTYSKCLTDNYTLDSDEIKKLEQYFEKVENLQFISEIIDSAIHAKSTKSSSILGLVAGNILKNKTELNETDLVIIQSLREMTDIDLKNFIELIENIEKVCSEEISNNPSLFETEFRTRDIYKTDNLITRKVEKLSLELTIEKLKRTGALTFGEGGIGSVGNAKGAFMLDESTFKLYEIIKHSNIE